MMKKDDSEKKDLYRQGFFTSPKVIDDSQVKKLRAICDDYYSRTEKVRMMVSEFLAIPELAALPFQPSVVNVLKSVLGNQYVTVPEFTVQTNQFGGWHTDAANQGYVDSVYRAEYMQIQCGIYLQDNQPEYGGGLDVVPKSHKELLTFGSSGSILRRGVRRANASVRKPISIWSKAGDLVGFHYRLRHKATARSKDAAPKYAIFFVAVAQKEDAENYMAHLSRSSDEYYIDMTSLKFPAEYPGEVVDLAASQHLNIATI